LEVYVTSGSISPMTNTSADGSHLGHWARQWLWPSVHKSPSLQTDLDTDTRGLKRPTFKLGITNNCNVF